jgi:RES domain-containing protein
LYRALHGPGLDGIGGTLAEGRWHSQGERVVYFGASSAIVVLERLAHMDPDLLPNDLRLGLFELPGEKEPPTVTNLGVPPSGWIQNESWSRNIGDLWLRANSSCLLAIPSVILPEEANYVFNPRHPGAKWLRLIRERPFSFDPRLL